MAEAVAARDVRGSDHARGKQVVDRRQRIRLRERRGGRRQVEVEGLAGHRGAPGEPPRAVAEARDLLPERRRDGRWHVAALVARELLEVERVAAALAVQAGLGAAEQ